MNKTIKDIRFSKKRIAECVIQQLEQDCFTLDLENKKLKLKVLKLERENKKLTGIK